MKIARKLGRSSVGFEVNKELIPVIKAKVGVDQQQITENDVMSLSFSIRSGKSEIVT